MKRKKWDKNECDIATTLFKEGKSYKEISLILNRTRKAVNVFLNKNGYSLLLNQKEVKKCLSCDKEFNLSKGNKRKFCNNSCAASYNNRNRKIDYLKTKKAVCIDCGTEVHINIFNSLKKAKCSNCSLKHKSSFEYNKDIKRVSGKYICLNCGKEMDKKAKYCSVQCQVDFKKNEIIKKIESGDITLDFRYYKKYLIEKYGEKCMECGWNKKNNYSNTIPIELEHVDGNCENNKLENLKLLCPNCHSLTSTYKHLNVGHGKRKRNK